MNRTLCDRCWADSAIRKRNSRGLRSCFWRWRRPLRSGPWSGRKYSSTLFLVESSCANLLQAIRCKLRPQQAPFAVARCGRWQKLRPHLQGSHFSSRCLLMGTPRLGLPSAGQEFFLRAARCLSITGSLGPFQARRLRHVTHLSSVSGGGRS